MADISRLTGTRIHSDPEAWATPSGGRVVEHLACEGDNHALLVFWFDAEIRREGISTERWVNVGPRNITCVVLALAAHPTNANVLYAGSEFGGVWKTVNGGSTWIPTMDNVINPCVGAVAVSQSHPNVIYAGMSPGKIDSGGSSGVTVYRSNDGGAHWIACAGISSDFTRALAVHPTNSNVLYCAGNRGVHKSIDGGSSWTDVLAGDIDDIQMAFDSPDTVYSAVAGQGIFKTTSGGTNWTRIGTSVSFKVLDDNKSQQDAALDGGFRTRLAVGRDQRQGKHGSRFIVAKVQGTIVISTDGGGSWSALPGMNHGYDDTNWWDSCVAVCPTDEEFVVAGGGSIQFTLNAAASAPTWHNLPDSLHVDQQAIEFTLSNPNDFYFANDGYVGLARNRGAISAKVSDGLVSSECFNVGVSQGPSIVTGCSTYHTGTIRTGRSMFFQWERIDGPEGGLFEIDAKNGQTMFDSPWGQYQLHRSFDGGSSWEQFDVSLEDGTVAYIESLGINPSDTSRMYASGFGGRLHFSTNAGDEWNVVLDSGGAPLLPNVGNGRNDGNFTFAFAPSNSGNVYLGTNSGRLWRTTNGSTSASGWAELNPPLPINTGRISAIAVSPGNPNSVLVGYQIDGSRAIWRGSVQAGGTVQWTDVGGSPLAALPQVPINAVMINPHDGQSFYAATDLGMFVTRDGGNTWSLFGEGLPRVRILDMQLRARSRMLYVAAYGRGIFRRWI